MNGRADRAHNYLYARLNNCDLPTVLKAANLLHDLRNLRNKADYDTSPMMTIKAAGDSVAQAESILQTLDAISPLDRAHITNAIKLYEQGIGDVTWRP
jgi:hypothetical protein